MTDFLPLIEHLPAKLTNTEHPYFIAITGTRHVGKTMALKAIYALLKSKQIDAAGFIEKAIFINDQRIGYDFFDLVTREKCMVARRCASRVPYTFEPKAWDWVGEHLRESESSPVLLIDELGKLEAAGNGIMPELLSSLMRKPRHLIASVRDDAMTSIETQVGLFDEKIVITPEIGALDV